MPNDKIRSYLLRSIALIASVVSFFFILHFFQSKDTLPLEVYIGEPPSSLDPLDFDLAKHMPVQSLLNAKLFSNYKDAGISRQLVKNWRTENGYRVWRFEIRRDVKFSDGSFVSPEIVAQSLKRLFFVLKTRKSRNELLSQLIDTENLVSPGSPGFNAIRVDNGEVVVKFKSPVQKFPEMLGFGLYAVVHPGNFDQKSGEWIGSLTEKYVGAGPYRILSTSGGSILLKVREYYPTDLLHPSAFRFVKLSSETDEPGRVDLRFASEDLEIFGKNYRFQGAGKMSIFYFICYSWNLPKSPCYSKKRRVAIRDSLLKEFQIKKIRATSSFFPLSIPGISEPKYLSSEMVLKEKDKARFRFVDLRQVSKTKSVIDAQNALDAAVRSNGHELDSIFGMSYESEAKNRPSNLKSYSVDIGFSATSVTPYDPEGDVRFMFSSEGINLPDTTGEIYSEVGLSNFSIQRVNELLFEQAVVWPVAHVSRGIWSSPRVDLSRYGTLLPLGELQWIGQK